MIHRFTLTTVLAVSATLFTQSISPARAAEKVPTSPPGVRPETPRGSDRLKEPATPPKAGADGKTANPPQKPAAPVGGNRQAKPPQNPFARLNIGPDGLPLPADRTDSDEARRVLEDAKDDLSKALEAATPPSVHAIDAELWRSDTYREAMLEFRRRQSDYDAVRRPIFDALREDELYATMEKKREESERVIRSLILTGRGTFDWLFPHALAAMEVRSKMTREQIIALAQAPEVEEARQNMLLAAARLRELRSGVVGETGGGENAIAAKADVADARVAVRDAQAAYNAAINEEAEYEAARRAYIAELRRTGRPPAR